MSADRNLVDVLIEGGRESSYYTDDADHLAASLLNDGPAQHTVTCPTCEGDGAVSGFPDTPWERCPTCSGAGTVTVRVTAEVVR